GEPRGRVGKREGEGLRPRALDPLIAGLFLQKDRELVEKDALFGRGIGDERLVAPDGEQVQMHPDEALGVGVAEPRGDECAPVAALYGEALVSERAHEPGEAVRDRLDAETLLPRCEREPVARQRRRDDGEGVGGIAAEPRRVGEKRDEFEELEDRSRPAVREKKRAGRGAFARYVKEMEVDVVEAQLPLRERVE